MADYQQRPADIIFVIDNSESMTEEIESVQKNINQNFASIIAASGIDYRVIMLSKHGSATLEQSVCIEAPLGSGPCTPVPLAPNSNAPHFYQFDYEIGSLDSLCLVLDTLKGGKQPRNQPLPNGWSEWLRPDSLKVFVEITDDGADCATTSLGENNIELYDLADDDPENENVEGGAASAEKFDTALTQLAPEHFGTQAARNYMFFSFVGIKENMPVTTPWPPEEPPTWEQCRPGSVDPGTTYQTLSVMTGALRYPINQYDTYDAVFEAIAGSVISGSKLSCEVTVPEAPAGHALDLPTMKLKYTPSDGGAALTLDKVDSPEACSDRAFYIENELIKLCPDTCAFARQDNSAKLEVIYACSAEPD
ncbi:hypothetical protein SOCE26_015410 [Sorangium cellulosum]|uniref:Uncharacterized protein n=1 Tax=Sorangium cellulosum TaxID=56 RepID=A0A2L0ELH2_SORCE|nr:hypothetical protein [Sorangium cellulosum]AUX40144.1 hypothetical protein SOCE26_015410 [Sorangium cellulosum]